MAASEAFTKLPSAAPLIWDLQHAPVSISLLKAVIDTTVMRVLLLQVLRDSYEYHGLNDLFFFCITALAVTLVS